uniref:Cytochrome b5 heme-binding domain-containing protein n=1 Tax=Chrysotila carterae TaxID=13221 RepID=A0A7S4AY52_CHRCT|mmetsp:Transcript_59748/g.129488  ORF Transcript_59748/g.129488 Transcript_59748/m.129488 type:complete len:292 (+) Transcript_59748:263-1138(+)
MNLHHDHPSELCSSDKSEVFEECTCRTGDCKCGGLFLNERPLALHMLPQVTTTCECNSKENLLRDGYQDLSAAGASSALALLDDKLVEKRRKHILPEDDACCCSHLGTLRQRQGSLSSLKGELSALQFGDESDSQAGALHATANAILLGERDGLSLTGIRREGDELANASTVVRTSSTTSTDGRASPAPVSKAPEPLASSAIDNRGRRSKYFSREEVALHNKPNDCWLIAHGRVYDVTSILATHPAGMKSIMRHAGTDSTTDFDFHSANGRKLWAPLLVGYVDDGKHCVIS